MDGADDSDGHDPGVQSVCQWFMLGASGLASIRRV
jgi:hypothetical protein